VPITRWEHKPVASAVRGRARGLGVLANHFLRCWTGAAGPPTQAPETAE
jgi:hypothetical protein